MILAEIEVSNDIGNRSTTFKTMLGDWNRRFREGWPSLIGKLGQFRLAKIGDPKATMIAAYDLKADKYAAFIDLQHFHGGAPNAYQVNVVAADRAYRGINLPVEMYVFLILEEGYILVSDEVQTSGGRSIWEKLSKIKSISIYGYNTDTKKVFQVDMDDLFNEDVYSEGLDKEIETLENEEYELQDRRDSRYFQVKKELEKLYAARIDVNHNVRLFAARAK